MNFILRQIKMLISTGVIMTCALGGSIGVISLIRAFAQEVDPEHDRKERTQAA